MCSFLHRACAAKRLALLLVFLLPFSSVFAANPSELLSLGYSLEMIKLNDFRLKQLQKESEAYISESQAAEYLPDPTVFTAIQSLPTDTFDLDQEPMTQLRVGVRQMFPKGNTLDIKADLADLKSELQTVAQHTHWLSLKQSAEQAWLEAWFWQRKKLI